MRTQSHSAPKIIAVGGGKGGVGKSMVSANLALALAKLGARVTAVDADLGSANLHTMFGIDRPGLTLQALFDGRAEQLQEVVIPTGHARLDLVPGSVAIAGAANIQHARKQKLLRHLLKLDAEIVVVDCGAGINFNVLDFFNVAHTRILVATPQLISLQNAYGFMKASVYRVLRQAGEDPRHSQIIEGASDNSETETVRQLLDRVDQADNALGATLRSALAAMDVLVLGNQIGDPRQLAPISALARMLSDFLTLRAPVLGGITRSSRIHDSITRRRPYLLDARGDADAEMFFDVAERLVTAPRVSQEPPPALLDEALSAAYPEAGRVA